MKQPDPKNIVHLLACGFGSGLAKKAPGTWGTVVAVALWWPLSYFPPVSYVIFLVVATAIGVWLCDKTARELQVHDHPAIVWDEFCGYWLTMLLVPRSMLWALAGFILFRLFDIWKPWPVSWVDKYIQGGVGIMMDDLIAGIFAAVVLQIIIAVTA